MASIKTRQHYLALIFLSSIMPGIVVSTCYSTMGKQIVHCSQTIDSIRRELVEKIDQTTSVIVLKDMESLIIDSNEHFDRNFQSVTSYQLSRIKYLGLEENAFLGLNNLLILKFADCAIDILPNNVFNGLRSLEILELINCNLKHIEEKAFDGLANLHSLDLTNNKIKTISKRLFENIPNLNSLALYKNEINTLEMDCFKYLSKLTTLGLSANNLRKINAETFNLIPNLTYLYASFNHIESIEGNFICRSLKFIDLKHNNLRVISSNLFRSSANLIDIDLAFNNITYIDEFAFENLPRLMNLHLRNCTVDVDKLKFVNKPLIVL